MDLIVNSDFDVEMLTGIATAYNELKEGDLLNIYFQSSGGRSDIMHAIQHLIERNNHRTCLYFYGHNASAAFNMMVMVDCPKHLLNGARGMFHCAGNQIFLNEYGKPDDVSEKAKYKALKKHQKTTQSIAKRLGLTPKEQKRIDKGFDVYFSEDRLKEIMDRVWTLSK